MYVLKKIHLLFSLVFFVSMSLVFPSPNWIDFFFMRESKKNVSKNTRGRVKKVGNSETILNFQPKEIKGERKRFDLKMRVSTRTGPCAVFWTLYLSLLYAHTHRNQHIYKQLLCLSHTIFHVCCSFLLFFFFFYPSILIFRAKTTNNNITTNKKNKIGVMGLFLSRNLACKFIYPFLFSKKVSKDLFPKQLENMMSLISPRTGRHLQRYDNGCRQVVGCVSLPSSSGLSVS